MNNLKVLFYQSKNNKAICLSKSIIQSVKQFALIQNTPIFDCLENYKPDIIFLNESDCKLEHIAYAKSDFPETKFVLLKESNNDLDPNIPFDMVIKLNNEDKNKEFYLDNLAYEKWGGGSESEYFSSDILYISDDFDGSPETTHLLQSIGEKYKLKIFGEKRVPCCFYLGKIREESYSEAVASTKIVLMFNDNLLKTALFCNKTPLVFSKEPRNHCEFSTYEQLEDLCELHIKSKMETMKLKIETYSDFWQKALEELYK
jgi:hypothetical protein